MTVKFKVGNTYTVRSICDYDCIFSFEVIKRTEKTVTLKSNMGTVSRRVKKHHSEDRETCMPHGSYSMAPCLTAI